MVKANGYPTRTRDRKVPIAAATNRKLRIDHTHRFIDQSSKMDSFQREQFIKHVGARVDALSPATKRVLTAVRQAMVISFTVEQGYSFRPFVNRASIAQALGRTSLVPYDIRMLRQLCDQRLVEEYKHALPRKQHGDIWLGAGAEFVYTISIDVLFCLLYNDTSDRKRLQALKQHATTRPPATTQGFDSLLKKLPEAPKRTLLDRVLDWLNI